MSQISLDTFVVGTYTIKEIMEAERLWTPDKTPSTPEQILERYSVARKALHDRIGFEDPKGYYHLKGKSVETEVVTPTKAEKPQKPAKAKNAAKRTGTKGELSIEIFKRLGGDRVGVIAAFQEELGMSKAGATTYFYNAKRIVG
jgi:hypothetical protein